MTEIAFYIEIASKIDPKVLKEKIELFLKNYISPSSYVEELWTHEESE